jgi:hypothetical protein
MRRATQQRLARRQRLRVQRHCVEAMRQRAEQHVTRGQRLWVERHLVSRMSNRPDRVRHWRIGLRKQLAVRDR